MTESVAWPPGPETTVGLPGARVRAPREPPPAWLRSRPPLKRLFLVVLVTLLAAPVARSAEPDPAASYESGRGFVPVNAVDVQVLAELRRRGIEPANPCSDAVFVRRVHLDLLGALPHPAAVRRFLRDADPGKRAALIDDLLRTDEFADYWTLKWCDLLRVKAEFPINLWPNGVQAYYRWIHDALRENRPLDRFARELLTASGSSFRVPPVNFYRAVQRRTPEGLAGAVALTFMGMRLEAWPPERRAGMAAFFSRVVYKPTAEWKEEIVIADPAPAGALEATFPDGTPVVVAADDDPRRVFADWLLAPGNPFFARSLANRAWAWLFGRGIVHEPDDLRADNPPVNPGLLALLEHELVRSGYDLRQLFGLILNSRTWQASPVPQSPHAQAEALFAHYPVRRLDAEVLQDALVRLDGTGENYVSQVPEPFTILPDWRRAVLLEDGSVTSPFLEMFGRPARDSGLESERSTEPTDAQRLYLLNSTDVQRRIERSRWLRQIVTRSRNRPAALVDEVYLALLSRHPTAAEVAVAVKYAGRGSPKGREAVVDLAWALINTKEFLYRH